MDVPKNYLEYTMMYFQLSERSALEVLDAAGVSPELAVAEDDSDVDVADAIEDAYTNWASL